MTIMKRLRCIVVRGLTLLSLLLCLATLAASLHSVGSHDMAAWSGYTPIDDSKSLLQSVVLDFRRGRVSLDVMRFERVTPEPIEVLRKNSAQSFGVYAYPIIPNSPFDKFVDNRWWIFETTWDPGLVHLKFGLPAALLGLVLAMLPAWWTLKWLKTRKRKKEGLCLSCGYDLRASPGRCPECGMARALLLASVSPVSPATFQDSNSVRGTPD